MPLNSANTNHTRWIMQIRINLKILDLSTLWLPYFEIGDYKCVRQFMGIRKRTESNDQW